MASSQLLDNIKKHVVAKKVCEPVANILKEIIADIVADPFKFNDYPKLAYIMHKGRFDVDELSPKNVDFSYLNKKAYKEDLQALQNELNNKELEYCVTTNSPEQFFFSVMKDNEDIAKYKCIHEIASKVSEEEIIYKVDCDNIATMTLMCEGISTDYTIDGCH